MSNSHRAASKILTQSREMRVENFPDDRIEFWTFDVCGGSLKLNRKIPKRRNLLYIRAPKGS